jgi:hypothetical protein
MEGRRHSKVRQALRERLMREHTDRRIEERRKETDDTVPVEDLDGIGATDEGAD